MLTTLNKISLPTKDPWKRKWIPAKKTKTAATKNSDPEKWKQKLKRRKHYSIDIMITILSINIMLTTLNKISLPTKDPWKRKWIPAKKTKTAATKNSDHEKWKKKLKRRKHIST